MFVLVCAEFVRKPLILRIGGEGVHRPFRAAHDPPRSEKIPSWNPFVAATHNSFMRSRAPVPTWCCCIPFPLHHHFWDGVLDQLTTSYRVFLPDLRAHGDSEAGEGPVTMQKLADDLDRLCRELGIVRAIFVGVSIGGYALFEFWRRYRERVAALGSGEYPRGSRNC